MSNHTATYERSQRVQHSGSAPADSPFHWLQEGWHDLIAAPVISAFLGFLFTFACVIAYLAATAVPQLSAVFLLLLLMVSPFIAAAAYFVVHKREQGVRISMHACLKIVRSRSTSIALFSLLSALLLAAWVRLTSITFAIYYGSLGTSAAEVVRFWTAGDGASSVVIFLASATVVFALALFAMGAISLPLIADRNCNVIDAVRIGLHTLRENSKTMLVW
ncbi:MAG: DUF2189 domain-containing protein, partial [Gammaproteobacteria bacterium]